MRLWPTAAGAPLRAIDKDVQYDCMVIPAGSILNVHFFSMFRSDWIANAETFDPDRWLDTNSQLPQLKEMFILFKKLYRPKYGDATIARNHCLLYPLL